MQYRNLASKLLLSRQWELQHLVPLDQPASSVAMMRLLSKTVLRPKIKGIQIKAPIFIIGTPRCGSTMLQELMCCHDKIAYFTAGMDQFREPSLFRAVEWTRRRFSLDVRGERYLKDSIHVDGGSPSEAMRFWGESLRLDPHQLEWPVRRIGDFTADQIATMKDSIRSVIACFSQTGGERFVNKSPALFTEVLLLQELFPDAKFVYLVRDGRMVANSLLKLYKLQREQDLKVNHPMFFDKPFVPYPRVPGLVEAAQTWGLQDIRTTATVWDSSVKLMNSIHDQIRNLHEIRYEDILKAPRAEMQKIFDFCELPPMTTGSAAYEKVVSNVGIVHHKNSYGDFEVIEKIAGDSLKQYGYA